MSIDVDRFLVETATKVAVTINEDGDINYGGTSSSACLYRDISVLTEAANMNTVNIDGQLWFAAAEDVERGDIYYHPDEGYLKIEQITKAKRLVVDDSLQFKKCLVSKQRQVS